MKEESKIDDMRKYRLWPMIWITMTFVLTVFFVLFILMFNWFEVPNTANEFGDSFGMANTLFSALAFAFLIVTAIMQKNELELQRKELSETKKELKRSADSQKDTVRAMGTQVSILAKQALLSSYQSMYNINMSIINSSDKSPLNKKVLQEEAENYKYDMQDLIDEIQGDMKLFGDPLYPEKKEKLREFAERFMGEAKKEGKV